jgi:biopolymer transport protein ExbB
MSGMVAAISGIMADMYLSRMASNEQTLLEDHLTMDH